MKMTSISIATNFNVVDQEAIYLKYIQIYFLGSDFVWLTYVLICKDAFMSGSFVVKTTELKGFTISNKL